MNRRLFLQSTFAAVLASSIRAASPGRRPCILLRSSWQIVNIGDIAHTPGVLALIARHLPEAETILWASGDLSAEVIAMEHRRFPQLRIVKGHFNDDGTPSNPALAEAVARTDFLLHGSGPTFVAARDVRAFVRHTGKPFGVYGISHGPYYASGENKDTLNQARFIFFRDSVSLTQARADGVNCPVMEFGPDGAFACDVRDDKSATAFMRRHGLTSGQFACCIPRLRYTPYWKIRHQPMDARAHERHARNQAMAEHDHAPLREAIIRIVNETSLRVLVCPEDRSQMEVGQQWIMARLPAQVRERVVWRPDFWLTDEALSTYVRSVGLFGLEMHSPIMCIGNGVPAIVGRFAEQTSKGFMWRDIGLDDWLFDFDQDDEIASYASTVLAMVTDPSTSRAKAARAKTLVEQRQRETMHIVRDHLAG